MGCFVGAIISGWLSYAIGRRLSLIISAVLFTISAVGSGLPSFLPETVTVLVIFRIIGGLGIGIASMNAPMYIAEVSPSSIRGKMVTYYQLAIVIGFFSVFIATYYIGNNLTYDDNLSFGWRYMFWSELIPSALFLILLFFVPKSPRWLCLRGKVDEALKVSRRVKDSKSAELEINEIIKSIEFNKTREKVSYFSKSVLTIIIIGSVLSALQQFTGINAVLYYGADIFEKALGFGEEEVLKQQILLAFINVVFTLIAMFSVDRIGRKPLIYIGCVGMIFGFLLLGLTQQYQEVGLLSLIGILIFIGSFSLSMGPIVWVLLSEIFPNRIRSFAMSVAVAVQWAANYVVSQSFPMVMGSELNNTAVWNGSLPYYIFILFIVITVLITYRFIPETKGRSLEDLEEVW